MNDGENSVTGTIQGLSTDGPVRLRQTLVTHRPRTSPGSSENELRPSAFFPSSATLAPRPLPCLLW